MPDHETKISDLQAPASIAEAEVTDVTPVVPAPAAPVKVEVRTIEQWAKDKKTDLGIFAAAKAVHRWGIGRELTEEQYDEAVGIASETKMG